MGWNPAGSLTIRGEGVERIRRGELNIYLKWMTGVDSAVEPGDVVKVKDPSGEFLAWGFYEGIGAVAVRVLSTERDERPGPDLLEERLERAAALRRRLKTGDFMRLVHSEADCLPGLIVDVYGDVGVVSSTSVGMDARLSEVADVLARKFDLRAVFCRNDGRTRREVGLPTWRSRIWGEGGSRVRIHEGPLEFEVDVMRGQKTGFFIDQRDNRMEVEEISPEGGEVLDLYSYTGGFALHALAGGARRAVAVDESEYAVEGCLVNSELNGLAGRVSAVRSRVRDYVEAASRRGERFDLVVLDPPALVPSRDRVKSGERTYLAANSAAMGLVRSGGIMFTSSCSRFVTPERLRRIVISAAERAGREIRFLGGVRGASPDHPVDPRHPWTEYLKGFLLYVE